mgnify:CR=1 FL=1
MMSGSSDKIYSYVIDIPLLFSILGMTDPLYVFFAS